MSSRSVQVLEERIRLCEDGVREIWKLTEKIDELKASLPPLETKINELTDVSRGYESFKTSADKCLFKLRKRKQKLENNSSRLSNNAKKRASNLEGVALEISQFEQCTLDYQADIVANEKELPVSFERVALIYNDLKRLLGMRDDLFDKMLSPMQ